MALGLAVLWLYQSICRTNNGSVALDEKWRGRTLCTAHKSQSTAALLLLLLLLCCCWDIAMTTKKKIVVDIASDIF